MHWQYTPYFLPTTIIAALSAVLALLVWRRRPAPGAKAASVLMAAAAGWTLGYAFELAGSDLATKIFWAKVQYPCIVTVPVMWLVIALNYTGRGHWLTRRNFVLLMVVPVVTVLLVWTNQAHGLIWSRSGLQDSGPFLALDVTYGIWFWLHTVYSYLLYLVGTLLLIPIFLFQRHLYRGQVGVILIGALFPFLGNVLYLTDASPLPYYLDLTPFMFIITGCAAVWGLMGLRLLNVKPLTRRTVVDSLSDSVIVLDTQQRIVDLNPAAQRIITLPARDTIGQPAAAVLPDGADQILQHCDVIETHNEISLGDGDAPHHYDLRITPLHDQRSHHIGWLAVLHDITERRLVEEKVKESERRYRTLVETMNDGLGVVDENGLITFVNEKLCQMFGYSQDEMIGRPETDFADEANQRILREQRRRRRHDKSEPYELVFTRKDGQNISTIVSPAPILDMDGRFKGSIAVITDITERKRTEEKVFELNRKLLAVQDAAAAIVSSLDLQDILHTVTREMINLLEVEGCAISGWDQSENTVSVMAEHGLAGWFDEGSLNQVYDLADYPLTKRVLLDRYAQQMTISQSDIDPGELAYMRAIGVKTLLMLPVEFRDRVGELVEVMDSRVERTFTADEIALAQHLANHAAIAIQNARLYEQAQQELAERIQAEQELQRALARNQAILDTIPDSMFYLGRDGQLKDYRVTATIDLPPEIFEEIVIGSNLSNTSRLPPESADLSLPYLIDRTLTSGRVQAYEYQLSLPQGQRDFEARLVASGSDEVLAIVRDITERKRIEEALQKSEANLRAIFDNSQQAFVLIDTNYIIQTFNRAAKAGFRLVLGKKIKEGDSAYDFVPHAELDEFDGSFDKAMNGESVSLEKKVNIGDLGKWFELSYNPVFAADGQVIGVCFSTINIDERKRMTEALVESEDRLLAELETVLIITRALVNEIDLNNLLEFIVAQAQYLTNADGVAVLLLSDDGQWFEVAAPSPAWSQMRAGFRFLAQGSLAELAITSQVVQVSNRPQDDERAASIFAFLEAVNLHSLMCAPLVAHGDNLGVLLIWNEHSQVFTKHDNRLMGLFADQAALALHNADLHAQNRQLAIEQERHRLARELHDSVTQSIYSMGLAAQTALRLLGQNADSRLRVPIEHIYVHSKDALTEMREQLYHLHPTVLDKDLVEALEEHCKRLSQRYELDIKLRSNIKTPLPARQQDSLFYITREALWNIVKHASAKHINVALTPENDHIVILIEDDGVGFDPSMVTVKGTMGLRNMKERAKLLGGTFELTSRPGEGTQVITRIPVLSQ